MGYTGSFGSQGPIGPQGSTAGTASFVVVYNTASNITYYPTFVANTSGAQTVFVDFSDLTFNASTGRLDTRVLSVNATTNSTSTITGALIVAGGVGVNGDVFIGGTLNATSKSFLIDHPSKPGMKLQYGSLEGPENGVYVRGRTQTSVIELPDYWRELVDEETITVHLTPIDKVQNIYVMEIKNNIVIIGSNSSIDCFYTVYGERKDIKKLKVEY